LLHFLALVQIDVGLPRILGILCQVWEEPLAHVSALSGLLEVTKGRIWGVLHDQDVLVVKVLCYLFILDV